jgi:hypothetical protein
MTTVNCLLQINRLVIFNYLVRELTLKTVKIMDKDTIIEKLKNYKKKSDYSDKIKELGMFGSYATGKNSVKSDIDIFIKLEPAKMFDLIGVKNDLEKLFGKKIDIIAIRKSMNEYLKNQIKQCGIYV